MGSALLGAIDRRLLALADRRKPRPVDRLLVLASDAADYSVLWLLLAAARHVSQAEITRDA